MNGDSLGNQNSNPSPNWQLRFLIVFSLLLIVIFVYSLPTRFRAQTGTGAHIDDGHMETGIESTMMGELPSGAEIARLPIRTPALRTTLSPAIVGDVKEFRLEAEEFRWED